MILKFVLKKFFKNFELHNSKNACFVYQNSLNHNNLNLLNVQSFAVLKTRFNVFKKLRAGTFS